MEKSLKEKKNKKLTQQEQMIWILKFILNLKIFNFKIYLFIF